MDFLEEGYQYCSVNAYRLPVHERVDGYQIGQHPLVSRVIKVALNLRPTQPQYEATQDVSRVLNFIAAMGPSEGLTLREITSNLAMILALTQPSRSADLAKLDLRYRRFSPELVVFQDAGRTKQSRAGKPRANSSPPYIVSI